MQAGWYNSVHLHLLLLLLHPPHRHRPLLLHRPPHRQPDFHQAGAVEQFSMDIFHIFEYYFRFLFQALFLSAIALLTSASISSPLLFLTELEVKIILAENITELEVEALNPNVDKYFAKEVQATQVLKFILAENNILKPSHKDGKI